jgi:hypothetical protein
MAKKQPRSITPPSDPPTVSRVRAVRAKMWKDAGGTIQGAIELARREASRLRTTQSIRHKRAQAS